MFFSYTESDDEWNTEYTESTQGEIYGQQEIAFTNEFAKGEKRIETPFSPTPLILANPTNVSDYRIVSALNTIQTESAPRVLYYNGQFNNGATGFTNLFHLYKYIYF